MNLRIINQTGVGNDTQIELDGTPICHSVTDLALHISVDEIVTATLTLELDALEYDGPADIKLHPETAAILTNLGWTPPAQEETA